MGDDLNDSSASPSPDRSQLYEQASAQGGYFTAKQAQQCGFSRALLSHHVRAGNFMRVRQGLYRFREYPPSDREEVLAAWLALGKEPAIVSHETALDLLGVSDIIPDTVHITVPRSRRHLPSLRGVRMHTTSKPIRPEDVVVREGITVTSAARSILDAAEVGMAPDQVRLAINQAMQRGLITKDQLQKAANGRSRRVAKLVSLVLSTAAA